LKRVIRRAAGLSRTSYRYRRRVDDGEAQRRRALVGALARWPPRCGYRRVAALLRRQSEAGDIK
jgi:hypothetical protein